MTSFHELWSSFARNVTKDQVSCFNPDSKVHGANMGPIWGRQDPGGPHVGLMNLAIREVIMDYTVINAWLP